MYVHEVNIYGLRDLMEVLRLATICLLCTLAANVTAAPVGPITSAQDALVYLKRYGHHPADNAISRSSEGPERTDTAETLRRAILRFQGFANLNRTGKLDKDTLRVMNTPRCAVPDYDVGPYTKRQRRYALEGSIWPTTALQYDFINYTQQLSQGLIQSIAQQSFKLWSDASALTFTVSNTPDIQLRFARLGHGDCCPFDGPGGILGHGFSPDMGGQAHFDDDETWTDGTSRGTNLLQIMTHEIGHTLGMSHSNVPGAVMLPQYNGYNPNFALSQDDINGISILYPVPDKLPVSETTSAAAERKSQTPTLAAAAITYPRALNTPSAAPSVRPVIAPDQPPGATLPAVCYNAVLDAIVAVGQTVLAFQGDHYFVINQFGPVAGYPQPIASAWPAVGGAIDTAVYFPPATQPMSNGNGAEIVSGYLFFFKGSVYWKYSNVYDLQSSYPKVISKGFPGIPDNLRAVFIWSEYGKAYFVQGTQYYRYSINAGADPGYPRSMSVWTGVPSQINAALAWNISQTYFFVGNKYYLFDNDEFQVVPGFPTPISVGWFACPYFVPTMKPGNEVQGSPVNDTQENNARSQFNVADVNKSSTLHNVIHLHAIFLLGSLVFVIVKHL